MATDYLHIDQHWEIVNELSTKHNEQLLQVKQQMSQLVLDIENERNLNDILVRHINNLRSAPMPNPNINEDIDFAKQQVQAGQRALNNPDIDPKVAVRVTRALAFWEQRVETLTAQHATQKPND